MTIVNHVGLSTTDLARARHFYEQVLGFTPVREMEVPDGPTSTLLRVAAPVGLTAAYLERNGFTLELLHFAREGNEPRRDRSFTEPGLTHLSFTVDDIATTASLVEEHGGEVLADTDLGGFALMVRDPDGQLLELLPPGALGS